MLNRIGRSILVYRTRATRGLNTSKTNTAPAIGSIVTDESAEETPDPVKNDPNIFGSLSQRGRSRLAVNEVEKFHPNDKDDYDKEEYDLTPRKNAYYYRFEIGNLSRTGPPGLRKALKLFNEMKTEARLAPDYRIFSPLFYACAKAGYAKKAFELYEELLKYEKRPNNASINCLINVCAECPFPEYGLKRLDWFMTELKVKFNHELNHIHYNTAIKAYGKLGRLDEASRLVQQMIDQRLMPDVETFHSLLIGCASNKESGSALALRVFKRMKMFEIKPDTTTYRLMLRCIRDCGLGSEELMNATLRELPAVTTLDQRLLYKDRVPKRKSKFRKGFDWAPLITDLGQSIKKAVESTPIESNEAHGQRYLNDKREALDIKILNKNQLTVEELSLSNRQDLKPSDNSLVNESQHYDLPNVLSDDHLNLLVRIQAIRLDKLQTKSERLILFGGPRGFIEAMLKDGCMPDIRTISLILLCMDRKKDNFLELYKLTEELKIKRDVDFYDQLIGSICGNFSDTNRLELAMEFMEKLNYDQLRPTINTFENIALGCNKWKEARRMIHDLEHSGLVVSNVMIENFFCGAFSRRNYLYLSNLIKYSQEKSFEPSKECIENLEALRIKTGSDLAKREKIPSEAGIKQDIAIQFDEFCATLDAWLKNVFVKDEDHPWDQFNVPNKSKKDEFFKFVRHMKVMDKMKRETLQNGRGRLGNISYKAEKLIKRTPDHEPSLK